MKECEKYKLDLLDYATGEITFLTKKKQEQLFAHLRKCSACREAFFDYENIYALAVTEAQTKNPEFRQRMDALIAEFKNAPLPGEQDIDDEQHTGSAAGQIYRALKGNGKVAYPVLREQVGLKGEPFYEAVGWLLKEKKIRRTKAEDMFYVTLAESERPQAQAGV